MKSFSLQALEMLHEWKKWNVYFKFSRRSLCCCMFWFCFLLLFFWVVIFNFCRKFLLKKTSTCTLGRYAGAVRAQHLWNWGWIYWLGHSVLVTSFENPVVFCLDHLVTCESQAGGELGLLILMLCLSNHELHQLRYLTPLCNFVCDTFGFPSAAVMHWCTYLGLVGEGV